MFHTSDREVTHHGDPDRHIVRPGKGAPVAKLGGQSSQRLICARFITSCERIELAMTVLETHYHGRNCLAKVPIEQGL